MKALLRFGAVGAANTAFGFAVIAALLAAGLHDFAANAAGYACGLALSFALNRRWTFGVEGAVHRAEVIAFAAAVAVSWLVNLGVLAAMRGLGFAQSLIGQGVAMIAYSACFFVLSRRFVFVVGRRAAR